MNGGTVHVVGAGIAGLSAAVRLADEGRKVVLHEAARFAGGRCRSYHDRTLDIRIDNGNHLLLSGNHAAIDYLRRIGSSQRLKGPDSAIFDFADLASGEHWQLRLNDGRVPWWLFKAGHRVPGTRLREYFAALAALRAKTNTPLGDVMNCSGPLYERLWRPVLLAGLNNEPCESSAKLAGAMLRETLGAGGEACRPMVALEGLSSTFVDPALTHLAAQGATIRLGERLSGVEIENGRAVALSFGKERKALAQNDALVMAVPPWIAQKMLPSLVVPDDFRTILNIHFRVEPSADQPLLLGVVNGLAEWVFAYRDHVSVTISSADRLLCEPRERLAARIWEELAKVFGFAARLPAWQILSERRATFAATPEQDAKRPCARTSWTNIALAGDWTQTDLPATIEGAVRSGYRAASIIMKEHETAHGRVAIH